jgi:hypothetical protein
VSGSAPFRDQALFRTALRVSGVIAGWKLALCALAALLSLLFFVGLFVSASSSATGAGAGCVGRGAGAGSIPANYLPWLRRAAVRYRLGPRGFSIVAAIHKVESDFGRSDLPGVKSGTNSAGAQGPGQFLVSSWAAYGVDADGDDRRDPYSVPDSVFATANLLRAAGAPGGWHAAIFTYNHAEWYVAEVLRYATDFGMGVVCAPVSRMRLGQLPASALARLEYVARWIEARRIPYCWGGGHAAAPGPSTGTYCWSADGRQLSGSSEKGLDCSGAVRWLLALSGFHDPGGLRSDLLGASFPSGPGASVTIWSNVDHVFITINGRDWGTSESNFAHGPGFAPHSHAGFVPSHPRGL